MKKALGSEELGRRHEKRSKYLKKGNGERDREIEWEIGF